MCDRVAIINKGNIVAIDAPESLKKTIQSVQSIEVSFNHNSADQLDELRRLPMVNDAQKAGDKFKLYTEDPSEVIDAVMAYAHTHNLKVISITTLGPSLEDVFIRLTGLQRAGDASPCHRLIMRGGQNVFPARCPLHGRSPERTCGSTTSSPISSFPASSSRSLCSWPLPSGRTPRPVP